MKSMIFAAGLGTRLKPLTDTLPKALVPVCGRPLIEHVLRKIMDAGISGAVVNVHHFADKIEDWLEARPWISVDGGRLQDPSDSNVDGRMSVRISDERNMLLETGGAVLHARQYLEGCGSFLVHNVDILSNCDIEWFAGQVRDDAVATLLVSERKTRRYLLFEPDSMRLAGWTDVSAGEYRMVDVSACVFRNTYPFGQDFRNNGGVSQRERNRAVGIWGKISYYRFLSVCSLPVSCIWSAAEWSGAA